MLLAGLCALVAARVLPAQTPTGGPARPSRDQVRTISPGDTVGIRVLGEPDLSVEDQVTEDGTIAVPYVGTLRAAGLVPAALEQVVEEALGREILVDPQVAVLVRPAAKPLRRAYVIGEVAHPGAFELTDATEATLLRIVASAGGVTEEANPNGAVVIRDRQGRREVAPVRLADLIEGLPEVEDLALEHGDVVSVPKAPRVYLFGEVERQGVVRYQEGMTVVDAISLAGGLTDRANPKVVRILRARRGERAVLEVNVKEMLEGKGPPEGVEVKPGDRIIVSERWL